MDKRHSPLRLQIPLAQLRAFNCDYGQGWLFARALEPAQAEAMIAASEGLSIEQ